MGKFRKIFEALTEADISKSDTSKPISVIAYRYGKVKPISFYAKSKTYALEYALSKEGTEDDVHEYKLNFKNPLVIDVEDKEFGDATKEGEYIDIAIKGNFDGLIFRTKDKDEFYVTIK